MCVSPSRPYQFEARAYAGYPVHNLSTGLNYTTIQEGINANDTLNGHTLLVESGHYFEHIVVNKSISLIGEDRESTVIDGSNTGTVVNMKANQTIVKNFTICNSGTRLGDVGIYIGSVQNVRIERNIITNSCGIYEINSNGTKFSENIMNYNWYGLCLMFSNNNSITANIMESNYYGIQINSCSNSSLSNNSMNNNTYNFGILGNSLQEYIHNVDTTNTINGCFVYYLMNEKDTVVDPMEFPDVGYLGIVNSTHVRVDELDISKNWCSLLLAYTDKSTIANVSIADSFHGIYLLYSDNNTIENSRLVGNCFGLENYGSNNKIVRNIFAKNNQGICIDGCNNTIVGNTIENSTYMGICPFGPESNNLIYHNNFVHNAIQVSSIIDSISWDNGYPSGGNYWSDYTGSDLFSGVNQNETGSDGIGDTPYIIDVNNEDNYPLTDPWSSIAWNWTVDDDGPADFDTIQKAVDNAMNGDTIFVKTGIYYENVIVRKSVSIVAESRADTVISGNGTGKVFNIVRDATNITGFSIKESGGYPEGACIFLDNVTGCSVLANVIDNSNTNSPDPVGIFLKSSDGNTIACNIITNNTIGLNIISSSNNMITENSIGNAHLGMQVSFSSSNNKIFGNSLTNCDYGLSLDHAAMNNSVCRNHVERSSIAGVALETASNSNFMIANVIVSNAYGIRILWSSSNTFYHNNFVNNSIQVYVSGGYTNVWNSQYPSGGNYWSDYVERCPEAEELGDSGVWNAPYTLDQNNMDNYPLVARFSMFDVGVWNNTPCSVGVLSNSSVTNLLLDAGHGMISFNVSGEEDTVGFCRITIPNAIVQDLWHGNYAVLINDETWPFTSLTDSNNTYVRVNYAHSQHQIIVIPEFLQSLIPPLLMFLSATTIFLIRRQRPKKKEFCGESPIALEVQIPPRPPQTHPIPLN